MGKNLLQQEPAISLEHVNPGCMKGIFHHINHQKWYHVKKRLPRRRNNGGKNATVVEVPGNVLNRTDAGEGREEFEDEAAKSSSIHGKSSESGSRHKSSMKSRIKAFTEEVYKRRGRHHRSSSYPTRIPSEQPPSVHHPDASNADPYAETGTSTESLDLQDNLHSLVSSLLDPLLPRICGESATSCETCHLCASMLSKNYFGQSEVNDHGTIASLQESKLFFDALDLLNIRKEFFLNVLQNPNSSLSHHLHNQRASALRLGLTKSVSFPMPGSSGRRVPSSNSPKSKKEGGSCTEGETEPQVSIEDMNENAFTSSGELQNLMIKAVKCADDEAPKQLLLRNDSLGNNSLGSPKEFKKQHVNKLIVKRFKNLREKIKHAMKESRKDRQRIVMDGMLHKIPYGYPKDVKEEANMHNDIVAQNWSKYSPSDSSRNDQFSSSGKKELDSIRRTSSFNEPLSRYNRLAELCFNREANNHISDGSKLRKAGVSPATLGRIHSLPDLRSHSFSRIERLPETNSLEMPMRPSLSRSLSSENSSLVDQKLVALENQIPLDGSVHALGEDDDSRETTLEFGESFNDIGGSKRQESIANRGDSDFVHNLKMEEDATATSPAMSSAVKDLQLEPEAELPAEDLVPNKEGSLLNLPHEWSKDSPGSHENISEVGEIETSPRQSYNDLFHFHVDIKNNADFNYVRDVLELSGFSGAEFLGKLHSREQPMDPLVFEEVEGCLLAQPDCSGNEEGGSCNHIVLFDLINEVLLEIHKRTFSYWPKPLTCCSHVHPMPMGYHFLEDVWASINWYLRLRPEVDQSLDDAVNHDLSKSDGWMNIQFEAECVGIELEDMIFDDLLDELVFT